MRVMAVQFPAFCPLTCPGCRTSSLNRRGDVPGNLDAVRVHLGQLKKDDCLFITSTGEPGFTAGYDDIVGKLLEKGVEIAVCCANQRSIKPGFVRAEISRSEEQDKTSRKAIEYARGLGISYVATVVNFGNLDAVPFEELVPRLDEPDAVIIRQGQREGGAAQFLKGAPKETRIHKTNSGRYLGRVFPIPCFREFQRWRADTDVQCINHMGREVEWLGGTEVGEV